MRICPDDSWVNTVAVVVHVGGARLCPWTAATNGSIFHPSDYIWIWRVTVEWYWQGKRKKSEENRVPAPLCPPQIPHGQIRARTRAFAVTARHLTAWAIARRVNIVNTEQKWSNISMEKALRWPFLATDYIWTTLGVNLGHCGVKLTSDRLCCGTTHLVSLLHIAEQIMLSCTVIYTESVAYGPSERQWGRLQRR
jgi:hypothetical protein